jgi:magnesium transporter
MIKILRFNKQLSWSHFSDLSDRDSLFIIDCVNPTKTDLKNISNYAKITLSDISEAIDPDERPRVSNIDNYSLIIFKSALVKSKNKITTTPFAIFFNSNIIIIIRHENIKAIENLFTINEQNTLIIGKGIPNILSHLLDETLNLYFLLMDDLEDKINKLESKIINEPKNNHIKEIFNLKKILIFFHKAFTANREVIISVEKEYTSQIPKKDIKKFRYIYNDIIQLLDMESTYRDILTNIMDMHMTVLSNHLNTTIKRMTALGSFILIPTLISGIYGMNFIFMPEIDWLFGYPFALGIMLFSVIILYYFFKKNDYL